MSRFVYLVGLVGCLILGLVLGQSGVEAAESDVVEQAIQAPPPAYMIISVNEIHPDKMGPYKAAMPALTKKVGGVELLAVSGQEGIEVLEGEWNLPGLLLIEKYKSMDALHALWDSEEYQEVKKLREGFAVANFFVALEGRP